MSLGICGIDIVPVNLVEPRVMIGLSPGINIEPRTVTGSPVFISGFSTSKRTTFERTTIAMFSVMLGLLNNGNAELGRELVNTVMKPTTSRAEMDFRNIRM